MKVKEIELREVAVSDESTINLKKLLWKIDLRLIPYLSLLYMFSFLDRVNIGHARLYGLEKALNLTEEEFSWCLSIFFIGYVLFEVPSNLMMKRTSPPIWIVRIMVTWGGITMCLASVTNFSGLLAGRFFLGIAEAGLAPGIIFYLSFWYARSEQGVRIAFFFSASSLAGAFGGFIAYGINYLDNKGGLRSWQWIFIIEGLPTVLLGILTWFVMPSSPQASKWLTEEEKEFLNQRLIASHIEVQSKKFDKAQFISVFKDYKTYLYMLCYIGFICPFYSLALLMPTIVNNMGFSKLNSFLLTIPPYIISFFITMALAWNSDRVMERGYHIVCSATVALVGFIVLIAASSIPIKYFGVIIATVGLSACLPPALSWSNNNTIGSTKSATVTAMIVSFGNVGGIFSGQFYRASEAPIYIPSHSTNIGFLGLTIVTALILKWRFKVENKKLDEMEQDIFDKEEAFDRITINEGFRYII
ncbi:MFS general substrate transporter [Neoconidiobolus thromboides FSU 785]|nr:MFS general substrate transporter [Neoconidiobolus thromboides FSU 785]